MNNDDLGTGAGAKPVQDEASTNVSIEEEARAEEAFIDDAEDKVFNPFVEEKLDVTEDEILTEADMEIPGAVGSGDLETIIPADPINNESALVAERDEINNVNMQDLQSDIDQVEDPLASKEIVSKEEPIKVNIGEIMQPEDTKENGDVASQMDVLLNGGVVENTTPEPDISAETEGLAEPAVEDNSAPAPETAAPVAAIDTPTEMPVNPVAEAVAANPVVDTTAPTAEAQSTIQAAEPVKKKKKTGLIIAIIVVLLILIGGGVAAILYFNWHESKDNVSVDAMSKLLNIELANGEIKSAGTGLGFTSVKGTSTTAYKDVKEWTTRDYRTKLAKEVVDFELRMNGVSAYLSQNTTEHYNDDSADTEKNELTYVEGGKLYIKSGVSEHQNGKSDDDDDSSMGYYDGLDSETKKFYEEYKALGENAGKDVWIKLSDESIREMLGKQLYKDDVIGCLTTNYEKIASDSKQKVLDAYKENSFFEFGDVVENFEGAKEGLVYYKINIDQAKLDSFKEAVGKIEEAADFSECYEESESNSATKGLIGKNTGENENSINALEIIDEDEEEDDWEWDITDEDDDWETILDDDDEEEEDVKYTIGDVYFGVKSWTHEIKHAVINASSKYDTVKYDFELSYDAQTIAEPGEAKTMLEAMKDAWEKQRDFVIENQESYIKLQCYFYEDDENFYNSCVEEAKAEIEEYKKLTFEDYWKQITDLLTAFGGASETKCNVMGDSEVNACIESN